MSNRPEYEALVARVADFLRDSHSSWREDAKTIIAMVYEEARIVTPAMFEAWLGSPSEEEKTLDGHGDMEWSNETWANFQLHAMLEASALTPG
jgi:hypothetical protein